MSAEILKRSPLFKDFTPVGLEILGKIARAKIVLAGKPLFAEGAASESLFILVEGRLQILAKSPDGKDTPVASLGPGEHLGEMALLSDERAVTHLCTAVAETDSKLLEVSKADFKELMKSKPQACIKLLLALSQEFGAKVAGCKDVFKNLARAAAR